MAKPSYISGLKWYSTSQPAGGKGPVAKGSLQIGDQIFVNFVVWDGTNGPQVVFPRTENPKFDSDAPASKENRRYFDEVGPTSKEAREALFGYILADLEKTRNAGGASSSSSRSGSSSDDVIPF